ncbi:uncharacterized protein LOC119066509 [Bradysia coprophila]|uniref:uncharacterized protein LOC119066509 n=1 Tax=Bradysia coprophila TaxID=38358 RepID=UPI00187D9058|nr:uncharacterized protein LOC119066509 [Bradysia coprophila]
MDFETFAQSIQERDCTDSSDDSNFESLPDNESFTQIDSDDEYVPNNRIASSTRKRLQTFDEHKVVKRRKTSSTASGNRIERLPTRQPDPNVQNRNALMARENRRRKKEHVKVLEDQLEQKAQEIRCLRKILKQKDRTVKKLEHETLYLRSTIANKTDIMALLKTIRGNKLPLTSSALSFVAEDEQKDRRLTGSVSSQSPATSTATSFGEDEKENDYDLGFGQSTIDDNCLAMGDWRSLLNSDDDVKSIPQLSTASDTQSLVNSEHNYYQQHTNWTSETDERCGKDAGPGICLHLSGGRVSLEFCAACHSSSQNAWIEEM